MPTNYLMVNGMKIGHVKDGVRADYLTDALGSVTATKNQSQHIVNTYRYKPYGGLLAKTGTGDDPRYLWTGNTGSRVTHTRNVNQYNVHRHYANGPASWTSVDPLWPQERAYGYVRGKPTSYIDSNGTSITVNECQCTKCEDQSSPLPVPPPKPIMPIVSKVCSDIRSCFNDYYGCSTKVVACIKKCGYKEPNILWNCLAGYCGLANRNAIVTCGGGTLCSTGLGCGFTSPGKPCRIDICADFTWTRCRGCEHRFAFCATPSCDFGVDITLLHELAHCCGLGPDFRLIGGGTGDMGDCIALCVKHRGL